MSFRVGLALGGGGSRGAYQIGILKALEEKGILKQIRHVSGTSIGAINTMMVMANFSYERMLEVWEKLNNAHIYGQKFSNFKLSRLGLFSLQELYQELSKEIKISEIRNSRVHGYATATKLKKGSFIDQVLFYRMKKVVFDLNEIDDPHKATLASASIPFVFGTTKVLEESYIDGGALDNCPIQPLIDHGCNIIFAVPVERMFKIKTFNKLPILLINLKPRKLFSKIPIDVFNFKIETIEKRANYGYQMGLLMIEKLKLKGYLNDDLVWNCPNEFKHIRLDKIEEINLKEKMTCS